jgi:NAD+ synthase (glutamine-hydrolysing)
MRIALVSFNPTVGDLENNMSAIIQHARNAGAEGADLVVFPEMSICGYPPLDLLEMDDFVLHCQEAMVTLASLTGNDLPALLLGGPMIREGGGGKPLFNSAWFLDEGKVIATRSKMLLPEYGVFNERRYFSPAEDNRPIEWRGFRIGLLICEDVWNFPLKEASDGHTFRWEPNQIYDKNPVALLSEYGVDWMINLSASPFSIQHPARREAVVCGQALAFNVPILYVNQSGANTSLIFDGGAMAVARNGAVVVRSERFSESICWVNLKAICASSNIGMGVKSENRDALADVYAALQLGIKDYFAKNGAKKAVLGLSGGIDSAVVATLAADALGAENVLGVLLPSVFSSDHSIADAEALGKNLGIKTTTVPIHTTVSVIETTLSHEFAGTVPGLAEENIQSRIRGLLLMALSNKHGYLLLNTTNKSEASVGYGTLYGDMCGALSVLGDVYKTQVWDLARYINREKERIPVHSIEKAPSAELRPNQQDQDSLPPYSELDEILYRMIECRESPSTIVKSGISADLVNRVRTLVRSAEFKRHQMAPVLRIQERAFGEGRKWPLTAGYSF